MGWVSQTNPNRRKQRDEMFIDISGFYALLARGDEKHAEAEAWLKEAEKQRGRAVTPDYVLRKRR
jgi:predicted nucleic acid-binding protein